MMVWMILVVTLLASVFSPAAAAPPADAVVDRGAPDTLTIRWTDVNGVDVLVADKADATAAQFRLVSGDNRSGRYVMSDAGVARRYFLLRDRRTGDTVEAAERLLPLQQGSNFRDVGGYPAAGGRHVRWGLIFRSGATPLLTPGDLQQIQALGLREMVDLRSSEERVIAPTRIEGVPYTAVGYPMMGMMKVAATPNGLDPRALYRAFPTMLAPQLRIVFGDLAHGSTPIAYNCSAGQDRTGFATAMILSALGVPRAVILQDYLLSTAMRRPEFEMPKIDPALAASNPTARFFADHQPPPGTRPQPLTGTDGTPFLAAAFEEIDRRWGSVDAYLAAEAGVDDAVRAKLRALYLD